MPTNDTLDPIEAAHIAANVYFTLENWINKEPRFVANRQGGVEDRNKIQEMVLGNGTAGNDKWSYNPTLKTTGLANAQLKSVHTAQTGFRGISSGFGYTLTYNANGKKHVVIATRGTRAEMGLAADLFTDLRFAATPFMGFGAVHTGFKRTFDSIMPSLANDQATIMAADVVHCVGHSLGGAVATLLASHYRMSGKTVKLYTFGSPRVGCYTTHSAMENKIGRSNIFRVAHELDPITHVSCHPYIHLNPLPKDPYNLTVRSPVPKLSIDNHDMANYIKTVTDAEVWNTIHLDALALDSSNARLAANLLHAQSNSSWLQRAWDATLAVLFKLFRAVLQTIAAGLTFSLSPVDVLAEALARGTSVIYALGKEVVTLLGWAAEWAGIKIVQGANFTVEIIQAILSKMLASLRDLAIRAAYAPISLGVPMNLGMAGAWSLASYSAL